MVAASCYSASESLVVASHSFVEGSCAFEKLDLVIGLAGVAVE